MNERIDDYLAGMKLINENDQRNLKPLATKVIRLAQEKKRNLSMLYQ
jgi:hypothetical protein